MNVRLFQGDIEQLRPIVEAWKDEIGDNEFGIEIDINSCMGDLYMLANGKDAELLVLYDDDGPVGYMGLRYFTSPIGNQLIANEQYFFVVPDKRGPSSMRLLKEAQHIARLKGCSHIMLNASRLASDKHDKVCAMYEKMGMIKFETSYMKDLR